MATSFFQDPPAFIIQINKRSRTTKGKIILIRYNHSMVPYTPKNTIDMILYDNLLLDS